VGILQDTNRNKGKSECVENATAKRTEAKEEQCAGKGVFLLRGLGDTLEI
jgi:hypothetical protein